MFSIVKLQNGKIVTVPSEWVQHKNPLRQTKVFYSEDKTKPPDFDLETKFFSTKNDTCHYGYFMKKAESEKIGNNIIERKRKRTPLVNYKESKKLKFKRIFERIELSSDSSDNGGSANDDDGLLASSSGVQSERNIASPLNPSFSDNLDAEEMVNIDDRSIETMNSGQNDDVVLTNSSTQSLVANSSVPLVDTVPLNSDGDKTAHTDHSVGTLDIGQNICSSYESTKTREDNNPISSVNIIPSKPTQMSVVNSSFTLKTNRKPHVAKSHRITEPVVPFGVPKQKHQQKVCATSHNNTEQSQAKTTSQWHFDTLLKNYGITQTLQGFRAKPIPPLIPIRSSKTAQKRLCKTSTVNISNLPSFSHISPLKSSSHSTHIDTSHDKENKPSIWTSDILAKFRAKMKAIDESSTQSNKVASLGSDRRITIIPNVSQQMPQSTHARTTDRILAKLRAEMKAIDESSTQSNKVASLGSERHVRIPNVSQQMPQSTDARTTNSDKSSQEKEESQLIPEQLLIKLEKAKSTVRKLGQQIGVTIVNDSSSEKSDSEEEYELPAVSQIVEQNDFEFATKYNYVTNAQGDRFYLDGRIKITEPEVQILKKMNLNYLTRQKEFDYRFLARLAIEVFGNSILKESCVTLREARQPLKYKELDAAKFDFIKELFRERVKNGNKQRLNSVYRHINALCSNLRQQNKKNPAEEAHD